MMPLLGKLLALSGLFSTQVKPVIIPEYQNNQQQLGLESTSRHNDGVSLALFASLERMSRLVDIAYCVGTTGISPPFSCVSRCADFPSLHLAQTWNTGVLLSDSCGYIAVDHGATGRNGGDIPHEPEIVVAFRGTYSIANTIVDLSTVPQEYVPYPAPGDGDDDEGKKGPRRRCDNCTVHSGFLASWRNARKLVLPVLKSIRERYPSYPVHLTGHSLGGAVAALASLEIRLSLGWENVKVTTFGEPRVGNKALAEYVDAAFDLDLDDDSQDSEDGIKHNLAYRRVTHMGDPVPLLPLSEWGYRSHAGEVFIAKLDLQPSPEDLRICRGDNDPNCISNAEDDGLLNFVVRWLRGEETEGDIEEWAWKFEGFPARFKLWQLLFAHRDYFWRLGLCVPGGDPTDWGRKRYNVSLPRDEDENSLVMGDEL